MPLPIKDPAQNIDRIAHIENEAESIWHFTELLSKLGHSSVKNTGDKPSNADIATDLCFDDEVTLSTDTLRYVARQISNHVSNIVEHVEELDVL